ncbi:Uncharacterised protein [Mycobacteroides abscessus]|nr:Uncharacterised protein [Mycobacteroides abscessus]
MSTAPCADHHEATSARRGPSVVGTTSRPGHAPSGGGGTADPVSSTRMPGLCQPGRGPAGHAWARRSAVGGPSPSPRRCATMVP